MVQPSGAMVIGMNWHEIIPVSCKILIWAEILASD